MTINKPEEFVRVMTGFYDRDWLTWDPSVLELALQKNFKYDPDEAEIDQIESLRELLRSDRAFEDPALFENIILALNGEAIAPDTWQRAEPHQLAYGIYLIKKITGQSEFERPVRAYIAAALIHEDVHVAPSILHLDPAYLFLRSLSKISDSEIEILDGITAALIKAPSPDAMAKIVKDAPESTGEFIQRQAAEIGLIVQYLKDKDAL